MSSASVDPSRKFSWLKKMEAKIKKSLKNAESTQERVEKKST